MVAIHDRFITSTTLVLSATGVAQIAVCATLASNRLTNHGCPQTAKTGGPPQQRIGYGCTMGPSQRRSFASCVCQCAVIFHCQSVSAWRLLALAPQARRRRSRDVSSACLDSATCWHNRICQMDARFVATLGCCNCPNCVTWFVQRNASRRVSSACSCPEEKSDA